MRSSSSGGPPIAGRTREGWSVLRLPAERPQRMCLEGGAPPVARLGIAVSLLALGLGCALVLRR